MHDLHDLLTGREALQHLFAERALPHVGDEIADDGEVDVGFEEREADLAHRAGDRFLVELSLLAKVAESALELVGKAVEHRVRMVAGASFRKPPLTTPVLRACGRVLAVRGDEAHAVALVLEDAVRLPTAVL